MFANFKKMIPKTILILLTMLFLFACRQEARTPHQQVAPVVVPAFSADSAYKYIQNQVNFGPRVPNTPQHLACAAYLSEQLRTFGAEVTEQKAQLRAFDGTMLNAINIIGSYNIEQKSRILLFAHWDTRPWSDHDPDPANYNKPVLGANDGGSGVGVLLEIARQLQNQLPAVGVDIIFFDAEDYGAPENFQGQATDSWCLGSQYWSANQHKPGYQARFGILLDMVGAGNAVFYREQYSDFYAPHVVDKIWRSASSLGFSRYFINEKGGVVVDDHLYVNKIAGIPSANIIHYDPRSETGFGDFWHTVNDTMDNIDKQTLHAVGTTVMHVIYNEK